MTSYIIDGKYSGCAAEPGNIPMTRTAFYSLFSGVTQGDKINILTGQRVNKGSYYEFVPTEAKPYKFVGFHGNCPIITDDEGNYFDKHDAVIRIEKGI